MSARSYLGVDVGTSIMKAVLLDETGELVAIDAAEATLDSPHPGWYEQRLEAVLDATATVIRSVVARGGCTPDAVGITAQGDGVWLADAGGRAVRPAISWMDSRAAGVLDRWERDGVVEYGFRRTGSVMFPGCAGPLLRWLDEHEPRSLDAAATAGYCKDLVMQWLTGVRATDASDASLPFLEPRTRTYDGALLDRCGLAHRAELLAPIIEPQPVGELAGDVAERLGLPAGTPVCCGPFDLPACAAGAGVSAAGDGLLTIGTTLACQVLVDDVDLTGEPAGMTLSTGVPGRWLRAMAAMVGTAALDWVLRTVHEQHDGLEALLADSPPGARGVSCLPYFSPGGERAPFLAPQARARFDRLSLDTSAADLVRATCEGIAYAARHCFDAAGLTGDVAACGGGTHSAGWLQMFADVLGRPVRLAPQPETGARGSVVSALHTLGRDFDAVEWTSSGTVVEPDTERAERYVEGYAAYCDAVAAARSAWPALAEAR